MGARAPSLAFLSSGLGKGITAHGNVVTNKLSGIGTDILAVDRWISLV